MKKDRIKYIFMITVGITLFPLAYLIFGQGDTTVVLMVLPALLLLIIGWCGLSGVFDFSYLDEEDEAKK